MSFFGYYLLVAPVLSMLCCVEFLVDLDQVCERQSFLTEAVFFFFSPVESARIFFSHFFKRGGSKLACWGGKTFTGKISETPYRPVVSHF